MDRLSTYGESKNLVKQTRQKYKKIFSNFYFLPTDVQRYIDLGRAYYEKVDSGVIFIFDEERYYKVCLVVDVDQPFIIPKLDKKLLIRNVYRSGKKGFEMPIVEKGLESLDFRKGGTNVQIYGNVQEIFEKQKRYEKFVLSRERMGYRCVLADASRYEKVEELLLESHIIKDYHLDYFTTEEKAEGNYLCIVDNNDEMCAASTVIVKNEIALANGIAVNDKFKMHGLASILEYQRMKWLCDNHVDTVVGWIEVGNETSVRYHISAGYYMTDKYVDDWIRDVEE